MAGKNLELDRIGRVEVLTAMNLAMFFVVMSSRLFSPEDGDIMFPRKVDIYLRFI
jgi:hypothetical protein